MAKYEKQIDQYTITNKIGEGAYGTVYQIRNSIGSTFALKLLKRSTKQEHITRFKEELRILSNFSHENIISIYDHKIDQTNCYYVMNYIHGHSLQEFTKKSIRVTPKKIAQLIHSIANALEYSHQQGVIHRDIKPANILYDVENKVPFLTDFGLAKQEGRADITKSKDIVGTPYYLSPEQARGEEITEQSDVFALGATLYHLLVKKPPFEGANTIEVVQKIARPDIIASELQNYNASIPSNLQAICLKALNKDLKERYQNMQELSNDLEAFLGKKPVKAYQPKLIESNTLKKLKLPAIVLLLCLGVWILYAIGVSIREVQLKIDLQKRELLKKQNAIQKHQKAYQETETILKRHEFWNQALKVQNLQSRSPKEIIEKYIHTPKLKLTPTQKREFAIFLICEQKKVLTSYQSFQNSENTLLQATQELYNFDPKVSQRYYWNILFSPKTKPLFTSKAQWLTGSITSATLQLIKYSSDSSIGHQSIETSQQLIQKVQIEDSVIYHDFLGYLYLETSHKYHQLTMQALRHLTQKKKTTGKKWKQTTALARNKFRQTFKRYPSKQLSINQRLSLIQLVTQDFLTGNGQVTSPLYKKSTEILIQWLLDHEQSPLKSLEKLPQWQLYQNRQFEQVSIENMSDMILVSLILSSQYVKMSSSHYRILQKLIKSQTKVASKKIALSLIHYIKMNLYQPNTNEWQILALHCRRYLKANPADHQFIKSLEEILIPIYKHNQKYFDQIRSY